VPLTKKTVAKQLIPKKCNSSLGKRLSGSVNYYWYGVGTVDVVLWGVVGLDPAIDWVAKDVIVPIYIRKRL